MEEFAREFTSRDTWREDIKSREGESVKSCWIHTASVVQMVRLVIEPNICQSDRNGLSSVARRKRRGTCEE